MKTLDFHVHYTGNAGQVDRFVADWRERGVEKAVLFAFNYADGSFPTVDEIDKVAKRYPDFFIPFGYLNLGIHDCMAETRKAIERGFKGLKFIFRPSRMMRMSIFRSMKWRRRRGWCACSIRGS